MKIYLARDKAMKLSISKTVKYLNSKSKYIVFKELPSVTIKEKIIRNPTTHKKYLKDIKAQRDENDYIILVTEKPYDSNYFYEEEEDKNGYGCGLIILSLHAWKYLTLFSKENGLIYLTCSLLANEIVPIGAVDHTITRDCVSDFFEDKTRVNDAMRKGHFCSSCKNYIKRHKLTEHQSRLLKEINGLLPKIAVACKGGRNLATNELSPVKKKDKPLRIRVTPLGGGAGMSIVKSNKALLIPGEKIENATLFISYSHQDEKYRKVLESHLAVLYTEKFLEGWSDRQIKPGEDWAKRINEEINSAKIILLLISKNFLASKYCYGKEMEIALERSNRGEAVTIAVILQNCLWKVSRFANLQVLPQFGKPIEKFTRRDDGYTDVASQILDLIVGKNKS